LQMQISSYNSLLRKSYFLHGKTVRKPNASNSRVFSILVSDTPIGKSTLPITNIVPSK